jgi:hypothetical protein
MNSNTDIVSDDNECHKSLDPNEDITLLKLPTGGRHHNGSGELHFTILGLTISTRFVIVSQALRTRAS